MTGKPLEQDFPVTDADTFRLARGGRELLLGHPDEFLKSRHIPDRHIGEHFPIQENIRLLQGIHETAVRDAMHTGRGADARDPQLAEVAFPLLPS